MTYLQQKMEQLFAKRLKEAYAKLSTEAIENNLEVLNIKVENTPTGVKLTYTCIDKNKG